MTILDTLAHAAIGRREFVTGLAAGAAALATGVSATRAQAASPVRACAQAHAERSRALGRFVCDPANDFEIVNLAIRTASCPDCGMRLSADLGLYALTSRTA